jgi:thiamine transport system substrate-binding protein
MNFTRSLLFFFGAALLPVAAFASASKDKGPPANVVTVWTYDSFASEWGPGEEIARRFKAQTGITLNWITKGDAGALLAALLLAGDGAGADVVLGLDNNLAKKAIDSGLFEGYKPKGGDKIIAGLELDPLSRLIPYDYSYFSIVYDSEAITSPPQSLADLTSPAFKSSLILMDPRTSSPGRGFFAWVKAERGAEWPAYWRALRPSILTVADGWDSGYGLFTRGEAPLVLSYTTSPAYHLEYEGTRRYKAAVFSAGHPVQVEAAGILAAAPHKANARLFLDFMLTPAFQETIPLGNWMYPAIDIPLPASFEAAPKPPRITGSVNVSASELDEWVAIFKE